MYFYLYTSFTANDVRDEKWGHWRPSFYAAFYGGTPSSSWLLITNFSESSWRFRYCSKLYYYLLLLWQREVDLSASSFNKAIRSIHIVYIFFNVNETETMVLLLRKQNVVSVPKYWRVRCSQGVSPTSHPIRSVAVSLYLQIEVIPIPVSHILHNTRKMKVALCTVALIASASASWWCHVIFSSPPSYVNRWIRLT